MERAKARADLERRRAEGGVRYWRPANDNQREALDHLDNLLLIGGNRSGKTTTGAAKTVRRLLGLDGKPAARRVWCISQELPGSEDKPHTQLDTVKAWVPKDALRRGSWQRSYSAGARVLTLANGAKVEFKSFDQDLLAFESAAVDYIWFDEEPTRREIFTSCLLRLIDRAGRWLMTLTPVLSLQGKGAIAEELWDRRHEAGADYHCVQLFTQDNPHLPANEVAKLERLPEEERQVRLYGAFARLGGRVLSEFDPGRHLVADHIPDLGLRHFLVIDPGWNVAAHLFASVDRRGRITLYAEHYAEEEPIPVRMAVLHAMWQAFGKPSYDVIADSAAFSVNRQGGTEHVNPADMDEYVTAAEKLGATWFQPRQCTKGDPYAYRVKRYLQYDMLLVCRGLAKWRWEQERWTRQRDRGGPAALERAVPDRPIKRYDHLMDTTRYLCNELPDPEPLPQDQTFNAHQDYWEQVREDAEPAYDIV